VDKIVVLDFGSQTAQLISRRIRETGVYSEILPGTTPAVDLAADPSIRGIILSGSPAGVHDANAPVPDPGIYDLPIPKLGICYGLQRAIHDQGGRVGRSESREYGRSRVEFSTSHELFRDIPDGFVSWMSHGDHVESMPADADIVATSEHGVPAAVDLGRGFIGIQFHPEVTHCEHGTDILRNFAVTMSGAAANWSMEGYVEQAARAIRDAAGTVPVLLLISGGVDSTVVAALLLHAMPPEQVHLMYIDTGLMRKDETVEVRATLAGLGAGNVDIVEAESEFLGALAGVSDPEEKRRIIGDLFITIQEREIAKRIAGDYFLAQGTLYTDMIESGAGVGKHAHVIKSHHNVRSPLVAAKREAGRLIEPLSRLYKDEVRQLGRVLNVTNAVVNRHPFPGPGLAVRILGDVTREKCEILREADAIYLDELKRRGLYDKIWQAFTVLLPTKSVGVAGDSRKYGYVVALRAVVSADGMTADVYPFPTEHLLEISALITNRVPEIGRVVYDVSSKPPATIEWE